MSNTTLPTVQEIEALDGRVFSSLTAKEASVVEFFCKEGRKHNVSLGVLSDASPSDLINARSRAEADTIIKQADFRVRVTVSKVSQVP